MVEYTRFSIVDAISDGSLPILPFALPDISKKKGKLKSLTHIYARLVMGSAGKDRVLF
jgi:hypothetical protein